MVVSKNAKICVTPNANFEIYIISMQNPNASQWNIGCVGFQMQNSCVGHVHFMLFVSFSFALGGLCKRSFQWSMGFTAQGQP